MRIIRGTSRVPKSEKRTTGTQSVGEKNEETNDVKSTPEAGTGAQREIRKQPRKRSHRSMPRRNRQGCFCLYVETRRMNFLPESVRKDDRLIPTTPSYPRYRFFTVRRLIYSSRFPDGRQLFSVRLFETIAKKKKKKKTKCRIWQVSAKGLSFGYQESWRLDDGTFPVSGRCFNPCSCNFSSADLHMRRPPWRRVQGISLFVPHTSLPRITFQL